MSSRTNFLAIPPKRTVPLPELPTKIREYIAAHFRDTHPDAFARDVEQLAKLRRSWCEGAQGPEVHRQVVVGLLSYYAQISFLCTKFPADVRALSYHLYDDACTLSPAYPQIGLSISYHLPFPTPAFGFSPLSEPDPLIALRSLQYERAAVLFNIAAVYSGLGAAEPRSDSEGIKRALAYLQNAAGALSHLASELLPLLRSAGASAEAGEDGAGYDMTESFIKALENFVLAQAQECFWQKAVLEGTYKNGIVGRLAMKVSEYYDAAVQAANSPTAPAASFFPKAWLAHMSVKKLHFEAAAQYRISQEDLEKGRYGEEIARLQLAEASVKKALTEAKNGVAKLVQSDLKSLAGVLASSLKRAIRDNDLVYVSPIPPPSQLPLISPATMVKVTVPHEIANSLDWLMNDPAAGGALFSGLVPYGVHVALSVYDDRRDSLIRSEIEGKRDELDAISATTLQSLGLPGAITALERPTSLPPALLKKAEEIYEEGGLEKVQELMASAMKLGQADSAIIEETLDLLDQEAAEDETVLERHPSLQQTRAPSYEANRHLVDKVNQYQDTLAQARKSDADVREKWKQWEGLVGILAGGEASLERHIPTSGMSAMTGAQLPPAVRSLRGALEDLEDLQIERSRIAAEAKRSGQADDIRSKVVAEASRLAYGGSGDVKSEWFEDLFEAELRKYERFSSELGRNKAKQDRLLERVKSDMDTFLRERKEDSRIKHREKKLQEMELAYWKWREVMGNCQEGIKFYTDFKAILQRLRESAHEWVYSRRVDVQRITAQMLAMTTQQEQQEIVHPQPKRPAAHPALPPVALPTPLPKAKPQTFTLPPPGSGAWQSALDDLPPPPPQSGKMPPNRLPSPPVSAPTTSAPARVTRSSAAKQAAKGPIPNPFQSPGPRKGHGVV